MNRILIGSILLVSCFMFSNSFAVGEATLQFLVIAPGARAGGMGEGGVALASDATAVYWNPAGLAFQFEDPEYDYRGEVSFMHTNWLPGFGLDLFYDFLAARYYVDELEGMVGGSITYLNLGENTQTDEKGNFIRNFNSYEGAFALSYATKLQPNLGIGLNLKIIYSYLAPEVEVGAETRKGTATSFAVDIGVLWTPAYEFLDNKLSLGANLSNFGPKVTYINAAQADPMPTNLRLGLAYKLLDDEFNRVSLIYDTNRLLVYKKGDQSDNVFESVFYSAWVKGSVEDRLNQFTHSLGAEYWYGNFFALRAGYFFEHENAGGRQFATFGAGIKYDIFGFDFGYISADKDESPLADTMRFSLSVQF